MRCLFIIFTSICFEFLRYFCVLIGVESDDGRAGVQLSTPYRAFATNRSSVEVSTTYSIVSRSKPVSVSRACVVEEPTRSVDGVYSIELCMGACSLEWGTGPMMGRRSPVWWQVDLLKDHFVRSINLVEVGSGERHLNASVGLTPAFREGSRCRDGAAVGERFACSLVGRYVSLFTLRQDATLHLCEVDIIGDM